MRLISLFLSLLLGSQSTYPAPGPGRQVHSCTAPTGLTYRWTPTSGCSTSTACATDQVSGNNASQTTSGDLPTYGATCGPNSTPCLTFNGTSDYIIPATPIAATTDLTAYAIFEFTGGSFNELFAGTTNSIDYTISSGDATLNQQGIAGVNGNRTMSSGTWYTEVVTYHNATTTTSFYAVGGGTLASDGVWTNPTFTFSATTTQLGGNTLYSRYFTGAIAEWGYSNSVTTAGIAAWSSCHYGV